MVTDEQKKAEELVENYFNLCSMYFDPYMFNEDLMEQAKECALACVDETIEGLEHHSWQNKEYITYYKKVKLEIDKL